MTQKEIERTEIEAPYELPDGWKWCRLRDVCDSSKEKTETFSQETKYIGLEHIDSNGKINGWSPANEIKSLKNIFHKNQILYGKLRPYLNKHDIANFDGVCSTDILVFNAKDNFSNRYINYFFNLPYFIDFAVSNSNGINLPRVSEKAVLDMPFPLPPTLDEQQRIVNRIETMFAKLDQAQKKAQSVLDSFETRKAAILHKAFTGELTAKWRKENNPEKSSVYLEKIKDKVEIRLDFKYWENPNLPDSWCESTIGNLLYFAGRVGWKGLKAEEYTSEGPILLSVYNLNDGDEVSFNKINHITNERYDESPEIMVRKNDILLTKDGAGIGKLGYVNELPEKATINSSLLLIRPGDVANYKFIFYLLSGPALQNIVKERITGSATPHLFQRDIKEFVLPVPSLPEQQEIVRILDSVLEKESRAKESAQTVLDQIALLKKSILARAFRGKI